MTTNVTLGTLTTKKQNIQANLDQKTGELNKITGTDIPKTNSDIDVNVASIQSNLGNIESADNAIRTISGNISNLKNDLQNADEEHKAELETQLQDLNRQLQEAENNKRQLEVEKAKLEDNSKKLDTDLRTYNQNADTASTQIDGFNIELQDLDAEIERVKAEEAKKAEEAQKAQEVQNPEAKEEEGEKELPTTTSTIQYGDTFDKLSKNQLEALREIDPNATMEDAKKLLIENNGETIDAKNLNKLKIGDKITYVGNVDVSGDKSVEENEKLYENDQAKKAAAAKAETASANSADAVKQKDAQTVLQEAKLNDKARTQVYNNLVKEYNQIQRDFQNQIDNEGLMGEFTDGVSKLWNNKLGEKIGIATGNTEADVRKDLAKVKQELKQLNELRQKDPKAFDAAIKENGGIVADFNSLKTHVENYINSQETGKNVTYAAAEVAIVAGITVATGGTGTVALLGASATAGAVTTGLNMADQAVFTKDGLTASEALDMGKEFALERAIDVGTAGLGRVAKPYVKATSKAFVRAAVSTKAGKTALATTAKATSKAGKSTLGKVAKKAVEETVSYQRSEEIKKRVK